MGGDIPIGTLPHPLTGWIFLRFIICFKQLQALTVDNEHFQYISSFNSIFQVFSVYFKL